MNWAIPTGWTSITSPHLVLSQPRTITVPKTWPKVMQVGNRIARIWTQAVWPLRVIHLKQKLRNDTLIPVPGQWFQNQWLLDSYRGFLLVKVTSRIERWDRYWWRMCWWRGWIPRNSYMGVIKLFIHTFHQPSKELCRAQWWRMRALESDRQSKPQLCRDSLCDSGKLLCLSELQIPHQ